MQTTILEIKALYCIIFCSATSTSSGEGTTSSSSDDSSQAGVVTLLHNIIIAGNEQTRAWFAQYLKCMQQKVMYM